jgi:hypothetical protein
MFAEALGTALATARQVDGPQADEVRAIRRALQRDDDIVIDAATDDEDEGSTEKSNKREARRVSRFVQRDERFLHAAFAAELSTRDFQAAWTTFVMDQKVRVDRIDQRNDDEVQQSLERIRTMHREIVAAVTERTRYRLRLQLHKDIVSILRTFVRIRSGDPARAIPSFDEELNKELRKQRKSDLVVADIKAIFDNAIARFPRSLFGSPNRGRGRLGSRGRGYRGRYEQQQQPAQQQSNQQQANPVQQQAQGAQQQGRAAARN